MRVLIAWGVAFFNAAHYFLFRLRLAPQPQFRHYPTHWRPWLGSLLGWPRTLRVRFAERCPQGGPAVFVANHLKLDDPLFLWGAVDEATSGRLHIFFMMRDDFFRGWPWDYLPFSLNELTASAGCIQISRDQISLSQLKPFMQLLEQSESFVMFPGRTRSRSGLCIEYRDGIDEPGGVSFFLANGGRRAGRAIPAVPLARTFNPVTGVSVVAVGEPRYLDTTTGREGQRSFDLDLAVMVSNLTEIHALHVVSMLLYLCCLHGRPAGTAASLVEDTGAVLAAVRDTHVVDPAALADTPGEVRAALLWLAQAGMLRRAGEQVLPDAARILAVPELDTKYRKHNPVKFHVNQVLHFQPLCAAAEARVCGAPIQALAET